VNANTTTSAQSPLQSNPLLDFMSPARFDEVKADHIEPAMDGLIEAAQTALGQVLSPVFKADWDSIELHLDVPVERLSRAWGMINHLNAVMDSAAFRLAYNQALPKVTEFWTQLGSNEELFKKYACVSTDALHAHAHQALKLALRNFILGGAQLKGEEQVQYAQVQEQLAQLTQKFSENVLDATDAWFYLAERSELDGLPEDVIQAAHESALAQGQNGYRMSLKMPCYLPVMQYAKNPQLRQKLYQAYQTRASDQAETSALVFDNTTVMQEILRLRHQEAQLLGFEHFAALSLEPKMAQSASEVIDFLQTLARRATPHALQDLADLKMYAKEMGIHEPQAWDWTFIGEKLKEARYAFSEQEVKAYFPFESVLTGLFGLIQKLFDVRISPAQAPVWHEDVRFYNITQGAELVAQFYLDPFARQSKRGGAWMDDAQCRWLRPDVGTLQKPIAHLVCNFANATSTTAATLTHDDVITLFHEFGHGLHHMLSKVNVRDVSGINGVEWDAVELPSQWMENFCWEWSVVEPMTEHALTGERMPKALFDRMLKARNYQSGLQTLRQVEFALFDMQLHSQATPVQDVQVLLSGVKAQVSVIPSPAWVRSAHSFSHIFSGGYAAGYYSYKWAEVLSADAYGAFEDTMTDRGDFDPQTGQRFLQEILQVGGSRPALESFIAFRGRAPEMDALLRHQGMSETAPTS
jgi:oligopeptidase A